MEACLCCWRRTTSFNLPSSLGMSHYMYLSVNSHTSLSSHSQNLGASLTQITVCMGRPSGLELNPDSIISYFSQRFCCGFQKLLVEGIQEVPGCCDKIASKPIGLLFKCHCHNLLICVMDTILPSYGQAISGRQLTK